MIPKLSVFSVQCNEFDVVKQSCLFKKQVRIFLSLQQQFNLFFLFFLFYLTAVGSKIHSPQKKYFLLFLNTVLARQLPSLRKEQQLSTQQSLNSCIFPIACWGTRGQENNPLNCLSNALSLKETRVLSLASGMFAIHGGSRRRTEERARRGGERGGRTCCAVAVPQEMQLCSVY